MVSKESGDGNGGRGGGKPGRNRADIENANSSVGRALRSVFQEIVDESVPPDMLDLLGQLGKLE